MTDRATEPGAGLTDGTPVVVEPEGRPFGDSTDPAELDGTGPGPVGLALLAERGPA